MGSLDEYFTARLKAGPQDKIRSVGPRVANLTTRFAAAGFSAGRRLHLRDRRAVARLAGHRHLCGAGRTVYGDPAVEKAMHITGLVIAVSPAKRAKRAKTALKRQVIDNRWF